MLSYQEQLSNATRSQIEATLELVTSLTAKTFEGVEKILELNMNAARSAAEECTSCAQQMLTARDPQTFFSIGASQTQPYAEKAMAYSRAMANIAAGLQAELTRATEAQLAENNRQVVALVEEVSKSAPAGSENVVAFMKSAIGNASAGYEQLTKTTKQAVEAMEVNISNATAQMTQAAGKTAARGSRK